MERSNSDEDDGFIFLCFIFLIISPYFWCSMYYLLSKIIDKIKINKNRKLNVESQYIYYRDILSKISPSIISFVSTYTIDLYKDISATILKLKLEGYVNEKNDSLYCTNKDSKNLLESEKMILSAIGGKKLNINKYYDMVKNEAIKMKFIIEDKSNKAKKVVKAFSGLGISVATILLSLLFLFIECFFLGIYYPMVDINEITYIKVDEETYNSYGPQPSAPNATKEERLKNINEGLTNLNSKIRVDGNYYIKFSAFQPMNYIWSAEISLLIVICFLSFIPSITFMINRFKDINKGYLRTLKGIEIANNAYGLKNYLEKYSLINEKTEEEVVLFEYYLIYAISLGVNVKIENEIISKFIKLQKQ